MYYYYSSFGTHDYKFLVVPLMIVVLKGFVREREERGREGVGVEFPKVMVLEVWLLRLMICLK